MLMAFGAGAIYMAKNYHFGSILHMGPGFFPTILGVILILFGISILIKGLIKGEKMQIKWPLRSFLLLPFSLVLFGLLMERIGLIPALTILVFGSALASKEFRLMEVCLLTASLIGLSVALFIWVLGLPFPLFKGF